MVAPSLAKTVEKASSFPSASRRPAHSLSSRGLRPLERSAARSAAQRSFAVGVLALSATVPQTAQRRRSPCALPGARPSSARHRTTTASKQALSRTRHQLPRSDPFLRQRTPRGSRACDRCRDRRGGQRRTRAVHVNGHVRTGADKSVLVDGQRVRGDQEPLLGQEDRDVTGGVTRRRNHSCRPGAGMKRHRAAEFEDRRALAGSARGLAARRGPRSRRSPARRARGRRPSPPTARRPPRDHRRGRRPGGSPAPSPRPRGRTPHRRGAR